MNPLTIRELNQYIKSTLENETLLSNCYISGTVSGFKRHQSGHYYFTLKDETDSIDCAMFARQASRNEAIRQVENGLLVTVRGSTSYYGPSGKLSFICSDMILDAKSPLQLAYEALKLECAALGYFDEGHKLALPYMASCIGIVTSQSGAVLHDILQVAKSRNPLVTFKLFAVPVQGRSVGPIIAKGVEAADMDPDVEVIIVGRGGGSMEDLWCFNDKTLVEAIYKAKKPIISAVGHETDYTLCDYVADKRAATPSHAAELSVVGISELWQQVALKEEYLHRQMVKSIDEKRFILINLFNKKIIFPSTQLINKQRTRLRQFSHQLTDANQEIIIREKQNLALLGQKLDLLNPIHLMLKGFTKANKNGRAIKSIKELSVDDQIVLDFVDGQVQAQIKEVIHGQDLEKL